jgi:hypothetical protein
MRESTLRTPLIAATLIVAVCGAWTGVGAANLHGGNGVYRVVVADGQQAHICGVWTAVTGPLHPAGPGLELLFSFNGAPINSSYTTLRSYLSGRDYTTTTECTPLCIFAGSPETEPIERDGTIVGHRLSWTIVESPPTQFPGSPRIRFIQEVAVEGPVDGSETIDDSVVRETHIVENLGPGVLWFGLRKMWDLRIGSDDGPWLGDCAEPDAGCDRSLNLPNFGPADARYPRSVIFRSSPPTASCPGPAEPNDPDGCDGADAWVVAATVGRSTQLDPSPDAPQLLQFNFWSPMFGECWLPELIDVAQCGDGGFPDDTALAYLYGLDPGSAVRLGASQSRSFTQYVSLDLAGCPGVVDDDGWPPPFSNLGSD